MSRALDYARFHPMTRRDYVLIAEALKEARVYTLQDMLGLPQERMRSYLFQHGRDCRIVASHLKRANEHFDTARFLTACGMDLSHD